MAKTSTERKRDERARRKEAGEEEVRGIWALKPLHAAIKAAADTLKKENEEKDKRQ